MRNGHYKEVFTTGEVATICRFSQQTVIRCCDQGRIAAFRIPGSKFRKIHRDSLITFMRANGLPLDWLDGATKRILCVSEEPENRDFQALCAELKAIRDCLVIESASIFLACAATVVHRPQTIVLWRPQIAEESSFFLRGIRSSTEGKVVRIILVLPYSSESEELTRRFQAFVDQVIVQPKTDPRILELVSHIQPTTTNDPRSPHQKE